MAIDRVEETDLILKAVYGTPSLEESSNVWKLDPDDVFPTPDEYHRTEDDFIKHMEKKLSLSRFRRPGQFATRGFEVGDKSIYLDFDDVDALNSGIIKHIQTWLQKGYYTNIL